MSYTTQAPNINPLHPFAQWHSAERDAVGEPCSDGSEDGEKTRALQTLAKIYGWFAEGFDTADLKEARRLLEELERESK